MGPWLLEPYCISKVSSPAPATWQAGEETHGASPQIPDVPLTLLWNSRSGLGQGLNVRNSAVRGGCNPGLWKYCPQHVRGHPTEKKP